MSGAAAGGPRAILRVEGAVVAVAATLLYLLMGHSLLVFAALLLAPDLAMLGYLAGPRAGAAAYNLAHTYVLPVLLLALGLLWEPGSALGLVWAAHIGADRALGYGLKYASGFADTHLGRLRAGGRATRSGPA